MAKQRQVRVEQKSALAAMAQMELKSDDELLTETKYRAAPGPGDDQGRGPVDASAAAHLRRCGSPDRRHRVGDRA